jgi:hypothetical protein
MIASRRGAALLVSVAMGLGSVCSVASAADMAAMPVKAPPATPFVLDVHGFVDVTFKNTSVTPRGLMTREFSGLTSQVANGLSLDVYKDPAGFINGVSFYAGTWNDIWSKNNDPKVGSWAEFDWWVGMSVRFARDWKFGVEYVEFLSPTTVTTSFPATERNIEFSLAYDDSHFGNAIVFNPYIKLFYAASGPSTVVLGKRGDTFDVEIGMVPTLDIKRYSGMPLVFSAPTWITVGPKSYWNRNDGTTNFCGALSNAPCGLSNAGVFSTGLQAKYMLDSVIPKRIGTWYVKGGFQYYHIINDALLGAQVLTGAAGGASGVAGTFPNAHQDIVVGYGGFGFTF